MNLQETLELLKVLRDSGATHFKSHDFEVTLNRGTDLRPLEAPTDVSSPPPIPQVPPTPPNASIEDSSHYNKETTKKVEDLIDLLKSKDEDLVEKIFPLG